MRRFALYLIVVCSIIGIGTTTMAQGLRPADIARISESVVFVLALANGQPYATGSGTIVEPTGLIYTNHHVIEDANDFEIYVSKQVGELPEMIGYASVVKAFNEIDFAILQIDRDVNGRPLDPSTLNLPALSRGARDISLGDHITVFGYPSIGDGFLVITQGTITSVENANLFDARVPLWYRTDAEISPGNSGGLVVDDTGAYLGIPTMVRSEERTLGRLPGILPFIAIETVLSAYEQGMIPDTVTLTINNRSSNTEICYLYVAPTTSSVWGSDQLGATGTIPGGQSFTLSVEPGVYDVMMQDCSGNQIAQYPQRDLTQSMTVTFPVDASPQTTDGSLTIEITDIEYDVAIDAGGEVGFKVYTKINAHGYLGQEIRVGMFYYFADGRPVSCVNMSADACDPDGNITVQDVLTPSFEDTSWDYWFWIPYVGLPDGLTGRVEFSVVANVDLNDGTALNNPSAPAQVFIDFGSGGSVQTTAGLSIEVTSMEFSVGGDRSTEEGVKTYVDFTATGYQGVPIRVALFFFFEDGTPIPCPRSDTYYCDPSNGLTVQEVVTPSYDASQWNGYWMHVPYSAFPTGLRGTVSAYAVANITVDGTGDMKNPSPRYTFELYYN